VFFQELFTTSVIYILTLKQGIERKSSKKQIICKKQELKVQCNGGEEEI
jgi:hypothetical protein